MIEKVNQMLEQALNAYLKRDPVRVQELSELAGQCVKVHLTDLSLTFFLSFEAGKVNVLPLFPGEPGAVIKGKSVYFLSSALLPKTAQYLDIQGDVELGYQIYSLFKNVEIDWEEELSYYTGDVIAHEIGNIARGFSAWLKRAGTNFCENITEYLQEERQALPSTQEVEDFCHDVERLRQRVERLEAYLESA